MERVYKSLMGYKPENEKNKASHIILTLDEFNSLEREIRGLRAEIKDKVREHTTELEKFQEDTNKQVLEIKEKANKILNDFKRNLSKANEEIERLNDLNKNLLRINKERANAKRGLKPKKVHHGYMVLDSQQYNYIFRYWVRGKANSDNFPCWKVRIQSPYDSSISYNTIVKDIYNDLIKVFGASLDIQSITNVENQSYDDFKKLCDSDKNFIFKTSYKANIKSGFWEIEYLVKSSIIVPEDMRIS